MFLINSKLFRLNNALISRFISDSSSKKQFVNEAKSTNKTLIDDDDARWFANSISNNNNIAENKDSTITNDKPSFIVKNIESFSSSDAPKLNKSLSLTEKDLDKKRVTIKKLIDTIQFKDVTIIDDFNEKEWDMLLECNTVTAIKMTLKRLPKLRYYELLKEKHQILVAERKKERHENRVVDVNGKTITNYPGNESFMKRYGLNSYKQFLREKVLCSIRNDSPTIVFDWRYDESHQKPHILPSLYRQFNEIISINRNAPEPFQLHFCNYNSDGIFHKKYAFPLNYDENLVMETSKSYMDLFPKKNLVYLSKDSKKTMKSFDPEKIYIIGSLIDSGLSSDKFASYSQAKKDGIECLRLPLDENVKWSCGGKDLTMIHLFHILTQIYHGQTWRDALKTALPSRVFRSQQNHF